MADGDSSEENVRMRRVARVLRNEALAMRRANAGVRNAHEALVARLAPLRDPAKARGRAGSAERR
jgi:hypothetical protein